MNTSIAKIVLSALALVSVATSNASACSALALQAKDNVVIGHNLNVDYAQPTMVFINKRGTHKRSLSWEYLRAPGEIAEPLIEWRAKYGSVTFCCESVDFSTAGYNEAGLFVSDQHCTGSTWQPDPAKPKMHLAQWMQYVLDNYGSVKEVVEHFNDLPAYVWEDDHLFFADKSGNTAALEFVGGKPVITTGAQMPVKVSVNCLYSDAIAGKDGRFNKIKDMLAQPLESETPVERVWRTLDACPAWPPRYPNEWQVVVDTKNRKIQFASIRSGAHKEIDLAAVDFSESGRIKCLDVYTSLEGNVGNRMFDWTPEINARYTAEKSFPSADSANLRAKLDEGIFPSSHGMEGGENANIRAKLDRYCREFVAKSQASPSPAITAMPWAVPADAWRALRVGLFIHWGPSSGKALPQSHSHARKSALNPHGSVPPEVYDQFYKEFNPTNYHPDAWLKLAYAAGMRYAVFVAKHHDGFCMFKTAATDYNIMATPYGKDVAAQFAAACQRQGLALGWQISPKDWKQPDFNTMNHDRYSAYYEKLINELSSNYGPLAVMWFDGIEPVGRDKWKDTPARVAALLHDRHPNIMLGNHGGCAEDFLSFENMVAPFDRQQPWEMCEAINPSGWVFNKPMPPFPLRGLLRNLVYTVARDGNYLLDVGPMPDGQLYPPDAERLGELAAWMKVNAEGIHGTRGGPYRDGDWGGATCKSNAVYLFLADRVGTSLTLPALAATIKSARRLDGGPLEWQADKTSLRFTLADRAATGHPIFVCVKLELDRPAFPLPLVDGQPNLAAAARITASSVHGNATPQLLFDNNGDTAWETESDANVNSLEFDLGEPKLLGSLSLAEHGQPVDWNHAYKLALETRNDEHGDWQPVLQHTGTLGGPPILTFPPVRARYVRLELGKFGKHRLQISELRLFAPLEDPKK